ncbi:fimbrial protein [Enterobacter kobei]|uniref:fimbrial protein n=1 Tax=Enterobacter kobei TaxID=208224 RepID=UPI002FD4F5A0
MKKTFLSMLVLTLLLILFLYPPGINAADNLIFKGTLVKETCQILPGDDDLTLDFGDLTDDELYSKGRTKSYLVKLHLVNCDFNAISEAVLTFDGNESVALPGLLNIDSSSKASGIAIGFESADGNFWPIKKPYNEPVSSASVEVVFYAYVQAEPSAITNKSITPGGFTSTASFLIDYF